ncbi:MAG TPA: BON domain-containing protein [Candidatus Binatia bacterium]|nr:BON domain-containing protein [Candidatus Binatia bacterium]
MTKKGLLKAAGAVVSAAVLSATLFAQPAAARYDNQIENKVTQKLAAKKRFADVKSSVENGVVTLTGTVDLYQGKVDAGKVARKAGNVQSVQNLIAVAGPKVSDEQLTEALARKLTYVREAYDNTFDYFAIGVRDGVVTVEGEDRTGIGRDEALADIYNQPGVKDVISNIGVEPVSLFDEGIRLRTARAIYRDPVLSKYAIDPAKPIRIIVANGHVTLYGEVDNKMDKQVAGMRAGEVFGSFSVENKLEVRSNAADQPGM